MIPDLPAPAPLPDPPGSSTALGSAVGDLTAAGFSTGVLCHLLEPLAVMRGWSGADAAVAGSEVAAATAVADSVHCAATAAAGRLRTHLEVRQLVERRLAVLRSRQREQYAAAAARLGALAGDLAAPAGVPPSAAAVIAEVVAEETARTVEHRALLADLADDAAQCAAVLAGAAESLGGTGRPGTTPRVTAHLAAVLPGWGVQAMTGLGLDAATALTAPGDLAAIGATAARYGGYADVPVFADALARGLGHRGITYLLAVLGSSAGTGAAGGLAQLLARTLSGDGPAGALLDPVDPDGGPDVLAVGMGVVLAAPGARPELAAAWGRAMLEREHVQGAAAVDRTAGALPDPVQTALEVLLRAADGVAAATLLAVPAAWRTVLGRSWPDGGTTLAGVIRLGAAVPEGARPALAALEALGEGLAPGSTGAALDDRGLLPAVRDAVGGLVAAQMGAVTGVLAPVAGGLALEGVLRGLGLLLSQPGQEAVVTPALTTALRAGGGEGLGVQAGPPTTAGAREQAAEVAGAYVAVAEYGMRVRHALDCAREFANAVDRQLNWTVMVTLPSLAFRGSGRPFLVEAEALGSRVLRADGTVIFPDDNRPVRTSDDAARLAEAVVPGLGATGRAGFDRVAALLGVPELPDTGSPFDPLDDVDIPDRPWSANGAPGRGG